MHAIVVDHVGAHAPLGLALHALHAGLVVGGLAGLAWLLAPAGLAERASRWQGPGGQSRASTRAAVAVAASLSAGLVHLVVAEAHGDQWLLALGLVAAGSAQVAWALGLLLGIVERAYLRAGVLLQAACLTVWALSRTIGLGPVAGREPVGLVDLAVVAWQTLALVALVGLLSVAAPSLTCPGLRRWDGWSPTARAVAGLSGAVAVLAVAGALA